jgi:hypothetical protein
VSDESEEMGTAVARPGLSAGSVSEKVRGEVGDKISLTDLSVVRIHKYFCSGRSSSGSAVNQCGSETLFFNTVFWSLACEQVMEVTTPLASLPYKEQIKKKQREVVQLLQQLEDVSSTIFPAVLKCIFQPFELGSVTRLIRSAVINWRPGKFFKIFFFKWYSLTRGA